MKNIKQIFKGKEHLLEIPEIMEVLKEVNQYCDFCNKLKMKGNELENVVIDLVFQSDFVLIDGESCENTIKKIMQHIEKNP